MNQPHAPAQADGTLDADYVVDENDGSDIRATLAAIVRRGKGFEEIVPGGVKLGAPQPQSGATAQAASGEAAPNARDGEPAELASGDDAGDDNWSSDEFKTLDASAAAVTVGDVEALSASPLANHDGDSSSSDELKTMDAGAGDVTVEGLPPGVIRADGEASDAWSSDEFKTVDSSPKLPTIVPSEAGDLLEQRVSQAWKGAATHAIGPQMTIKAGSATAGAESSLVVKPRSLRRTSDADSTLADYELLDKIGEGGMGVVYAARQASIDRTVAIKMLHADAAADVEQRAKFLSEAVVTGDLDHPNIVPIHDLGANEGGALFYSMKRVQGTPWMKVIRRKTLVENLEILLKVADAVAFAHSRGVIHRDLKPENIMLGDFGEVLVMDWGLALSTATFRKRGSIHQSSSMGGTPAYMAPEMATGPIERVGASADIYLLGAMLFEIITGKPPHTGKNVMACLFAAARNDIQRTSQTGELLDLALKAMATSPDDRHPTVQAFQAAIRQYQSHSESIALSTRADVDLDEAQRNDDYQRFSRAVFGFQEALSLWDGNARAQIGVSEAKLAYAASAMRKRDFDLGLSLLDADNPSHAELRAQLAAAQKDQEARLQRLHILRRVAVGLVAIIVVVGAFAYFQIRAQRDRAVVAEGRAMQSAGEAATERDRATEAATEAATQRDLATQAADEAATQRDLAVAAQQEANRAAKAEQTAREREEYEGYIAKIGLAAAKIDENAYGAAADILASCRDDLRHWEWGRLGFLCAQSVRSFASDGPVDSVAFGPQGKRIVTGSWDGQARVWDVESNQAPIVTIPHEGLYVHSVAFSPDGSLVATGSNDAAAFLRVCNAATGEVIRTFTGHTDAVLSVEFSKDGQRLLSSSYDNTARLWDVASGKEIKRFAGHSWWVWDASFSADELRIVTASQDGSALVWSVETAEHTPPFAEHEGPVYSAAFSPDGERVATAGYDKRVLVWKPADLKPFDYQRLIEGEMAEPTPFVALDGHTAAVRSVDFSDDGGRILSGSHDNTIKLWDAAQGSLIKTFRGHAGWVRSCVFAPHGPWILSGSHDYEAMLWSIDGYEEVRVLQGRVLEGHADAVLAASFSPDGRQLLTASRDRTAKLWDFATGKEIRTFEEGHSFLASSALFTSDAGRIITSAVDNMTCVWDVSAGTETFRLDGTGRSAALALSEDDAWILTGSDGRTARLWSAATGEMTRELGPLRSDVTAVAFSRDGRILLTGESSGECRVWDAASGQELRRFDRHSAKIVAACFLPDGLNALTASLDNTVGHWNIETGEERLDLVLKHPDAVSSMSVSADGRLAVTSCADGLARVWEVSTAALIGVLNSGEGQVNHVSISRDGRTALTTSADTRKVRLWDVATLSEITLDAGGARRALIDFNRTGGLVWAAVLSQDARHVVSVGGDDARLWAVDTGREQMTFSAHGAVASASFSPDGERVVTGSWDNSAKIWDVVTGHATRKLAGQHRGYVNTAVFSRDGRHVLTASDDHTAKIWDVESAAVLRTLEGHEDRVRSACYSADGRRILTTSNDETARIWDSETGDQLNVLRGHAWAVVCGQFSNDGSRIITGSDDNLAKIWDAASGEELLTLAGHTAGVTSVALSPDGERALTGSQDNSIKLWDAATAKEILTLSGHTQEVTCVAFSRDGRYVISSSRDGTAIVWLSADWKGEVRTAQAGR